MTFDSVFLDEPKFRRVNSAKRRLEATAIVMLGVIGAEFGNDLEFSRVRPSQTKAHSLSLAWHTSKTIS